MVLSARLVVPGADGFAGPKASQTHPQSGLMDCVKVLQLSCCFIKVTEQQGSREVTQQLKEHSANYQHQAEQICQSTGT